MLLPASLLILIASIPLSASTYELPWTNRAKLLRGSLAQDSEMRRRSTDTSAFLSSANQPVGLRKMSSDEGEMFRSYVCPISKARSYSPTTQPSSHHSKPLSPSTPTDPISYIFDASSHFKSVTTTVLRIQTRVPLSIVQIAAAHRTSRVS